jgi:serine protease Do
MNHLLGIFLWLALGSAISAAAPIGAAPDYAGYVAKVEAVRPGQILSTGSAVSIAPGRLVTNCHVIRDATEIWVRRPGQTWRAKTDVSDSHRDLCILAVPGYKGQVPVLADTKLIRVGDTVVAAGYSDKRFSVSQGKIKDLYTCPCNGGRVIQTSATFEPGASGGGLFDRDGRLVGILTFKSTKGGDFHFALPVGWLGHLDQRGAASQVGNVAFWEQNPRRSGYFLSACALAANEDWPHLAQLAQEWSRTEPSDPEAWMALGRAYLGLDRYKEAGKAFQHVLTLDSSHAEAQWELQKLEFDFGEKLLDP